MFIKARLEYESTKIDYLEATTETFQTNLVEVMPLKYYNFLKSRNGV